MLNKQKSDDMQRPVTHAQQFLPRDAMRKCGLCCHPVSIRPSVTSVDCIQTAEDIVKLLSRPGSPNIAKLRDLDHLDARDDLSCRRQVMSCYVAVTDSDLLRRWLYVQMVTVYSPLTWGIYTEPPPDVPECGFIGELCPSPIQGKFLCSHVL